MAKIFISYRRADSQQVSGRIHDRLVQAFGKRDIFKDVDDIPPGSDYRTVLTDAIANCDMMLVVIGTKWLDIRDSGGQRRLDDPGDVVRLEIEIALKRPNTRVIPLLVEGAPMPPATALPDSLQKLSFANAFTLHDDPIFNRDMDTLIQQIREMFRQQRRFDGRWLIGAAILIGIATVFILSQLSSTQTDTTLTPGTTAGVVASEQVATTTPAEPSATATEQPSATPTRTPTIEIPFIVETLDARATSEIATQYIVETAAARVTEYAIGTQNRIDQTATATLWTDTPTPNLTASIDAYRAQQAATITQAWIDSWTDTPTATFTPSPTPIVTLTANDQWKEVEREFDGVEMVLVPPGCFMMGSVDGDADEQPIHEVCFDKPFWIDRYEVTNGQYGSSGRWAGDDRPRESVSWLETRAHCQSRNARLPTEAEWEYAARGPDNLVYPWGNIFEPDNVVYEGNSGGETAPVGSRPGGVSWVGAYDLSGSVREWVNTIYDTALYPYPYDPDDGREAITDFVDRVSRGGSWQHSSELVRAAHRAWNEPRSQLNIRGFRCARDYVEGDLAQP